MKKTHCVRGHEFTPENTRIATADGARVCRACVQLRKRKYNPPKRTRQQQADAMRRHRQTWIAFPSAGPEVKRSSKRRAFEKRKEAVDALKNNPCVDCGGRFHPCAMDFDHLDGTTKRATVSELVSKAKPLEVILAEVAKCELVCSNCHRVRTFTRAQHKSTGRANPRRDTARPAYPIAGAC